MNSKQIKSKPKANQKQNDSNMDDQFQGIDENQLNDSLQRNNQLFTLKSEINTLKIQKQKLSIEHQHALKGLQQRNKQLSSQNNKLKRQNANLTARLGTLQRQNDQFRQLVKNQVDNNRKTADFHRSIQDGGHNIGASDLINELLQKDKQIKQLRANLQKLSDNGSVNPKNFDSGSISIQKKQQEIQALKTTIQQLKTKQIAYKRQYEEMLSGKQQLIRKITLQNDENMKKMSQSKEKGAIQLRRQLQVALKTHQVAKQQIKKLEQKSQNMESMLNKLGGQYAKKQRQLIMHHEQQKQQLTKNMLQKIKKQYKQKEQKLKKSEKYIYDLQNQLNNIKQQIAKVKSQVSSANKLNKVLQNNIKQLEQSKSKLQTTLYEKDKQIIQAKEEHFKQITQVERVRIEDKKRYQSKILSLEQQIIGKKVIVQRYERLLQQKTNMQNANTLKQENALLEQIQSLRNNKYELNQQVQSLQQKNRQQIEKYYQLQRNIRTQYEDRILLLQQQLTKLRKKLTQQKKQLLQENLESIQNIQEKYKKLQNINQLQEYQIKQKIQEIQKLGKAKLQKQKQINELNQKVKQFKQKNDNLSIDYTSLQALYDEVKQKYKVGVENMKVEIENMSKKISEERKNAQKRRIQGTKAQQKLNQQLIQSKQQIKLLEQELDSYKTKKIEEADQQNQKMQAISQQAQKVLKQNQSLQSLTKSQSKALKQAQHNNQVHQQQKSKLLEYIQQLQQNGSILSAKLTIFANKEVSYINTIEKLDKQLKNIKLEYSATLQQMNLVLHKCKQLQEVSRESINHMELMRQKYEMLNMQFMEVSDEKNKHCQELHGAYDQVNKLNMVLMTKQQQLTKLKNIANTQKSRVITQTIHHYMPAPVTSIQHVPIVPMTQSLPVTFNTMPVQYMQTNNSLSPIQSPNSDINTNSIVNRQQNRSSIRSPGTVRHTHAIPAERGSNINFRHSLDENRDSQYPYKGYQIHTKTKTSEDIINVNVNRVNR